LLNCHKGAALAILPINQTTVATQIILNHISTNPEKFDENRSITSEMETERANSQ